MAQARSIGGTAQRAHLVIIAILLLVCVSIQAQGTTIRRHYVWEYAGKQWSFAYDFPLSVYEIQKSLPRTLDVSSYSVYVTDPRDDSTLRNFLHDLEETAPELNAWERLNWIVALVQSIPYASESIEYPQYPLETLIEQRGDCEDMAILTAALVQEMGFGVVMLAYLQEHHMAVGIRVLPPRYEYLKAYPWKGDLYFYLEPTSIGWAIGEAPFDDMTQPLILGLEPENASNQR